jgi:hypothetical protein
MLSKNFIDNSKTISSKKLKSTLVPVFNLKNKKELSGRILR